MFPMSSSNHHSHIEPSWKTYYDAKKLLRQTEQRLKDTRDYYPHVHLNAHHDNNDLSSLSSSSYLLHGDTSSVHAGNRSMLNDDRTMSNKHQVLDSEALQTIRRKISKQKIAAERRAEQLFHSQSDAGHMFESHRPPPSAYSTSASLQNLHYIPQRQQRSSPPKPPPTYASHLSQSQSFPSELDTVLRHSTSSRVLHRENEFERQSFHQQPTVRKTSKLPFTENYSLTNGRSTQQRSASASNSLGTRYQDFPSSHFLSPSDAQRMKHVRRVESAHASSGSGIKTGLITPDSWRTDPTISKKSSSMAQQERFSRKKTAAEIISKRTKTEIEESFGHIASRTEKIIQPKRDTSASKPSLLSTERTPLKPLPKPKSDDEKKRLHEYLQRKHHQHEDIVVSEKRSRDEQERARKDRLTKLNEQPSLSSALTKRPSAFTPVIPKDLTEQTRQRLFRLLGPSIDYRINDSLNQESLLDRSSSSSSSISSSNDSVIEVPPTRSSNYSTTRSRSEPPLQNGAISNNVQRHENLLRWAVNLTKDCDIVETKFKYLRPDETTSFDVIPPAYQTLQHDDGNRRYPPSFSDFSNPEGFASSRFPSDRLFDYSNDHRDALVERGIHRDRAAAKIQAAYRGYSVRKSLSRFNGKQNHSHDHKRTAKPSSQRETSAVNINIRLADTNYLIDSAQIRPYENATKKSSQQTVLKKPAATSPLNKDDYDIVPSVLLSNISTPNHQQKSIPVPNRHIPLEHPSTNSSTSTTPIPSPEPHVPSQIERRRSISPPLPPQMSPDNGRPLPHLTQTLAHGTPNETIESIERTKAVTRVQNPPADTALQQHIRKSSTRQSSTLSTSSSSSSSTNRKRRSPSPQQQSTASNIHSRHRHSHNSSPPTSSSESILTAREKRVRQKFNTDVELQAYEKRLKDIEKKIRQLVKRAFEIFDEKRSISSPPTIARTTKNDIPVHTRSKSSSHPADESSINEQPSPSRKETDFTKKDSDTSSVSTQRRQSDVVTSDASDLERRVNAYREQLKAKKHELERLKQRKNKEILRRQEDELKKQIESYDHEIQTLRLQPIQQEQTVPVPSLSSASSSTDKSKSVRSQQEKRLISPKQVVVHHHEDKESESPRDSHHDAQSLKTTTEIPIESETDYDSRRASIDDDKLTPVSNTNPAISFKEDSISSSSSISSPSPRVSKSPSPPTPKESSVQEQLPIPTIETKQIPSSEYDEDFSEVSHSLVHTPVQVQVDEIDIESIQEDLQDKVSTHDRNISSTSKSSPEEQSEILVLVKKSANTTPRQADERTLEEDLPPPPPFDSYPSKIESDDTSHDVSDDEDRVHQENQIDKLTETLIRTYIDEAIDQSKEIESIKTKTVLTKEASEYLSDEDLTDEETNKQILNNHEEDVDNVMQTLSNQPEFLQQLDTTTNGTVEHEDLKIDLSRLEDKTLDEARIDSPRKIVVEELIKPVVSHTREQVLQLCHEALTILYNQNTDFSDRSSIDRTIPDAYFNPEPSDSNNVDIQRSRQAYSRMIFDLCVELLHEMYSPSVRERRYPEWQKAKLISKRFYRLNKPKSREEAERFLSSKILEILHILPRQITLCKGRSPLSRQLDTEQFEIVLDEELRRTETQWIDYEDDCTRIKFDIAEYLFDQIVQETLTECFHVLQQRFLLSN